MFLWVCVHNTSIGGGAQHEPSLGMEQKIHACVDEEHAAGG
jgi:hypothetical protein